jgi:hypothetical protein
MDVCIMEVWLKRSNGKKIEGSRGKLLLRFMLEDNRFVFHLSFAFYVVEWAFWYLVQHFAHAVF